MSLASAIHSQSPSIVPLYPDPTGLLLIKNLLCWMGFEGPQINFSWTMPRIIHDYVEIRRKTGSFPDSPIDGKSVYHDDSGDMNVTKVFADLELVGNCTYYYTFFTKTNAGHYFADVTTKCKMLAIKTGFFENELWYDLPMIHRVQDRIMK